MYLLLWILGLPSLLYHCFILISLLSLFIYCKIYHPTSQYRQPIINQASALVDRAKLVMQNRRSPDQLRAASFATIVIILVCSSSHLVSSLEQDATILKPLASLAKSIIDMVTMGVPLHIDFGPTDLAKATASASLRRGFPVTLPRSFFSNAQDFYNDIKARVDATPVEELKRKKLADLKVDLDDIVDAIVEQARVSPDGIYTDFTQTLVNGVPLDEACLAVGLQLKAYGVDLVNYRNIAGMVLGVPLMPGVAQTVLGATKMANGGLGAVADATTTLVHTPINQMPGAALNVFSQMSGSAINSIDSLRHNIPLGLFNQQSLRAPVVPNAPEVLA